MTPTEIKANELIELFSDNNIFEEKEMIDSAIFYAKIHVKELLKILPYTPFYERVFNDLDNLKIKNNE